MKSDMQNKERKLQGNPASPGMGTLVLICSFEGNVCGETSSIPTRCETAFEE